MSLLFIILIGITGNNNVSIVMDHVKMDRVGQKIEFQLSTYHGSRDSYLAKLFSYSNKFRSKSSLNVLGNFSRALHLITSYALNVYTQLGRKIV